MEMYNSKLAVAIKHNGKILRENKDIVMLPYGSEFSVLVKNLNSRRVKFTLHIDGTDVLGGEQIIVNANSEVEMKRFIRDRNMDTGNAFKFIERTAAIEDGPRGVKVDDGVVRVEFWFEQEQSEIKVKDIYCEKHHYYDHYRPSIWTTTFGNPYPGGVVKGMGAVGQLDSAEYSALRGMANISAQSASFSADSATATLSSVDVAKSTEKSTTTANEIGITVPGSKVEQKFTNVYGFKSEVNSHVIILRIIGMVGEVEVTEPIVVNRKKECSICGKLNKGSSKFCTDCGAALVLL